jgi:drug/metabolite transporter (DMT)-like permease
LPVLLGFGGLLIVKRMGGAAFGYVVLLPLASSVAWAIAVVITRRLGSWDSAATTMLYSALFGSVGLSILLPILDVSHP